MKTRAHLWNMRITSEQEQLLDEGKSLELFVDHGIVIVQRDQQGGLHITFVPEEEAGFGLRGGPR